MPPQSKSLPFCCIVAVSLGIRDLEWAGFNLVPSLVPAEAPGRLVCFSLSTDVGTHVYFLVLVLGGGEVGPDRCVLHSSLSGRL